MLISLHRAPAEPTTVALVLAGGQGTRLHELTAREAKPALWFAGRRRLVDFTMANLHRSGIGRVIVATQSRPATLSRHLMQHWASVFADGGFRLAEGPLVTGQAEGYRGTAEVALANLPAIEAAGATEVLIVAGDLVYDMDYQPLIAAHRALAAGVTILAHSGANAAGTRIEAGENGLVLALGQSAAQPEQGPVSSGVYVFDTRWLADALRQDAQDPASVHDIERSILPRAVAEAAAQVWQGDTAEPPYWRDIDTLDAYRLAQLDFMSNPPCRLPALPGAFHPAAMTESSDLLQFGLRIVSGGIELRAPRWQADKPSRWAMLDGSVVLPGGRIAPGVRLTQAIVGAGTVVPEGLVVGEDPDEDARWFRRTDQGTVLVTTQMLARRAADRPRPVSGIVRALTQRRAAL